MGTFRTVLLIAMWGALFVGTMFGQTTAFTYQGSLSDGANPANGNYDFDFRLFNALTGGAQQGSTMTVSSVAVANGIFSVQLDFGSQFPGSDRFLEIRVRPSGGGGYTTLIPRQLISSGPYAIKSSNAAKADGLSASCLGCITADQIGSVDGSSVAGQIPVASVPAGSGSYIQNQTAVAQAASNFNISGDGTAGGILSGNVVRATIQFNIGNNRVLSTIGTNNLFSGIGAGANNSGTDNAFFGQSAGQANTVGPRNSFFGSRAGFANISGDSNSFFGQRSGNSNTTGHGNSFFGSRSGQDNVSGNDNSFFGESSGAQNTTGRANSFFGFSAGVLNLSGEFNTYIGRGAGFNSLTPSENTFVGANSGLANTTGSANVFVGMAAGTFNTTGSNNSILGHSAGDANTTGSNNTAIGVDADFGAGNLTYATAIGAGAVVTTSNRIQLGRQDGSDDVRVSGNLILAGLGTTGATSLCRNIFQQVAACSSSLRYKTNIQEFGYGLNLVKQLRPITFDWKDGGMHDLGLGAEDVAAIEPLLVTYNSKGEVEGVKYDRLSVAFVNAFKEQQEIIEKQQKQIRALTLVVCASNKDAEICKEQ